VKAARAQFFKAFEAAKEGRPVELDPQPPIPYSSDVAEARAKFLQVFRAIRDRQNVPAAVVPVPVIGVPQQVLFSSEVRDVHVLPNFLLRSSREGVAGKGKVHRY